MKKSLFGTILLVLLILSAIATNISAAQADAGGIGKWISVKIEGGTEEEPAGTVTAIKLSSEEEWKFPLVQSEDPRIDAETQSIKVGAGDVRLIAEAKIGYYFSHWEDVNGVQILVGDPKNQYEFKTSKGTTIITAVFELSTYEISYSVLTEGGKISITDNPNDAIAPPNSNPAKVQVVSGGSQKFWFFADEGYFVSAILKDGVTYVVPSESGFGSWYEFTNVMADHSIEVSFSEIGEPLEIPSGAATLFVGNGASLTFDSSAGGSASATRILSFPDGTAIVGLVWDIQNTATDSDGIVTITFYSELLLTQIIVASSLNATYCDVNSDGIIDGNDTSDVAKAVKSTTPNSKEIDPLYDVNNDGELTEDDVHRVNEFKGETVEYLEPYQIPGDPAGIYYVDVEHFCIFRGR